MPTKQKNSKPWLVAFIPDLHAGSSVAACPPEVELDDEAIWRASKAQTWLYNNLQDFIGQVKAHKKTHKIAVILGGDLVDGPHHHNSLQTFGSRREQEELAVSMLLPLANLADEMFAVRGTSGHSGQMADSDVAIARELGVGKTYFTLDVEIGGRYLNVRHHTSASRRSWTRGDSLRRILRDLYYQAVESGQRVPDVALRGHVHISDHEIMSRYGIQGAVSGCYKLSDEYVSSLPGELCSIGSVLYYTDTNTVKLVEYKPVTHIVKGKQ